VVGELGGVRQQVEQRLAQPRQVGVHGPRIVRHLQHQRIAVLGDQRAHRVDHVGEQGLHREGFEAQLHLAGLDLGQVQDVVDQGQQVLA